MLWTLPRGQRSSPAPVKFRPHCGHPGPRKLQNCAELTFLRPKNGENGNGNGVEDVAVFEPVFRDEDFFDNNDDNNKKDAKSSADSFRMHKTGASLVKKRAKFKSLILD